MNVTTHCMSCGTSIPIELTAEILPGEYGTFSLALLPVGNIICPECGDFYDFGRGKPVAP